jgi:hypothetical protein
MKSIVFCLEEPSAREMLRGVLPKILPAEVSTHYIIFQGKQDLERHLVRRLRLWRLPETRFVVMRDQDSADCHSVKAKLVELCTQAGKGDSLVRVACRELESFYLGDLAAVESGLGVNGISRHQASRKFRDPDQLGNPVQEIRRLTNNTYQKISGSRAIGPHLKLDGNRSKSFSVLVSGIKKLVETD